MELDLPVSPEEIMGREVALGYESWTSFASSCPSCSSTAVQRTLSLCLCPSAAVETAIAQYKSRWAMARGHRLNTSIVMAAVHVSPVFFGRYPRSSLHSFVPFPFCPRPYKPSRFRGRKATLKKNPRTTRPHRNLRTVCPLLHFAKSPGQSQSFSFVQLEF